LDLLSLLITYFVGFIASYIFVSTGGIGLVTTPALIFLGLDPRYAIATDLFAMLGGAVTGMLRFSRAGMVDVKLGLQFSILCILGAFAGTQVLLISDPVHLKNIMGVALLVVLALVLAKDHRLKKRSPISRGFLVAGAVCAIIAGFWSTYLGAGFLVLSTYILVFFYRRSFLEAAATLKITSIATGLIALFVYGTHGTILWDYGLAMMAGKMTGNYFGAGYALKKGEAWVRKLFAVVVVAISTGLLLH